MKRWASALSLFAVILAGCAKEEEPPPENAPPPPPTAEELAQRFMASSGMGAPPPPPGTELPAGQKESFVGSVSAFKSSIAAEPNGAEALAIVTQRIDARLREFQRAQMWEYVVMMCEGYDVLEPGSTKYKRVRDEAMIQLRKPRVTVNGIIETGGRKTILAEIYTPIDGNTTSERLRVGDETHGIRVTSIVGDDRGITYEYLETGETVEALIARFKETP